jgi:hypothetical protein
VVAAGENDSPGRTQRLARSCKELGGDDVEAEAAKWCCYRGEQTECILRGDAQTSCGDRARTGEPNQQRPRMSRSQGSESSESSKRLNEIALRPSVE